jgi:hypothetical protein
LFAVPTVSCFHFHPGSILFRHFFSASGVLFLVSRPFNLCSISVPTPFVRCS